MKNSSLDAKKGLNLIPVDELTPLLDLKPCNILLMAVAHETFKAFDRNHIKDLIIENGSIYDIKNLYKKGTFEDSGIKHWKL